MIAEAVTVLTSVLVAAAQLKADLGVTSGAQGGVGVVRPSAGAAGWIRPELAVRAWAGNAELYAGYSPSLFVTSDPRGGVAHAGRASLEIDAAPSRRISGGLDFFVGPTGVRLPTGALADLLPPLRSWHEFDANLGLREELTRRLRLTLGLGFFSGGALRAKEQSIEPRYFGPTLNGALEYDLGRNDLLQPEIELGRSFYRTGGENFAAASAQWVHLAAPDFRLSARAGGAVVSRPDEPGVGLLPILGLSAERGVRWRTRRLELASELELAPRQSIFTGRRLLSASGAGRARWIVRERLAAWLRLGGAMAAAPSPEERGAFASLGVESIFLRDFGLTAIASAQRRWVTLTGHGVPPWAWVFGAGLSWRMRDLFEIRR
jgi:hypothetical protein